MRLDYDCSRGRRNDDHWTRGRCCCGWLDGGSSGGRLGDHCLCRRPRGDCGRRRRRNDGRSRARLWHDAARRRRRRRCCNGLCRSSRGRSHNRFRGLRGRGRPGGNAAEASLFLFFLLFGQDCLHHIAWFGDVRQVNFWSDGLLATRRRAAGMRARCARVPLKVRANLLGFPGFKRTGVGLASADADFGKNVENSAGLDFQLLREIVDSNLAHPPLFKTGAAKTP